MGCTADVSLPFTQILHSVLFFSYLWKMLLSMRHNKNHKCNVFWHVVRSKVSGYWVANQVLREDPSEYLRSRELLIVHRDELHITFLCCCHQYHQQQEIRSCYTPLSYIIVVLVSCCQAVGEHLVGRNNLFIKRRFSLVHSITYVLFIWKLHEGNFWSYMHARSLAETSETHTHP